jgi:N-acetylglucosaminyldiphosphoundecaprenol N-acetyl-beta-D-mannosaminyltransferase
MEKELQQLNSCFIAGMRVDNTTYEESAKKIIELAAARKGSFICICNSHVTVEAYKNAHYKDVINSADIVTPDGMPLVWSLRIFGLKASQRVCGTDLLFRVCQIAQETGVSIGFYGSKKDILSRLVANVRELFPKLNIPYAYSPPFRTLTKKEDEDIINDIKASGVGVLFIGLGCPKQELWAGEHLGKIPAVMITVGAAFDFIAGTKKRAPLWMQRMGLEWFHRLVHNPRRLWRRYLVSNIFFIILAISELIKYYFKKITGKK